MSLSRCKVGNLSETNIQNYSAVEFLLVSHCKNNVIHGYLIEHHVQSHAFAPSLKASENPELKKPELLGPKKKAVPVILASLKTTSDKKKSNVNT